MKKSMVAALGTILLPVLITACGGGGDGGDAGGNPTPPPPPATTAEGVYGGTLTGGASPCVLPGETVTGIAIVYPLSTGQTQLIAAVRNSSRTAGVAVFGIR